MKRRNRPVIPHEPEPPPLFSESEQEDLARLVRKFGRETVADYAMKVPLPRPRGRQPLSFEEAYNLLWCIDRWTEEAREDGSKHPVADALKTACEITELSLKRIKDKRRDAKKLIAELERESWLTPPIKREGPG
jgi:hypothetical protein